MLHRSERCFRPACILGGAQMVMKRYGVRKGTVLLLALKLNAVGTIGAIDAIDAIDAIGTFDALS